MKQAWLRGALALSLLLNLPACVLAAQVKTACAGCCSKTCCVVERPATPSIMPGSVSLGLVPAAVQGPVLSPDFSLVPAGSTVFHAAAIAGSCLARGPPRA